MLRTRRTRPEVDARNKRDKAVQEFYDRLPLPPPPPPPPPSPPKPLPQDGAWPYPDTAKANSLTGGADGKGDWKPRVTGAHRSALIALMRNRRGRAICWPDHRRPSSKVTSRTGSTCWVPFVDLMDPGWLERVAKGFPR